MWGEWAGLVVFLALMKCVSWAFSIRERNHKNRF